MTYEITSSTNKQYCEGDNMGNFSQAPVDSQLHEHTLSATIHEFYAPCTTAK